MHGYSQNLINKLYFYFWTAAASVVLWFLADKLYDLPFSTASGVFIALWFLFENVLWKWIPNRFYPDLNGFYKGEIVFDNPGERLSTSITVTIEQSFGRILISGKTEASGSRSRMAAINKYSDSAFLLEYTYDNTFETRVKNRAAKASMGNIQDHLGCATLKIEKGAIEELKGNYVTAPPLSSSGSITLTRCRPDAKNSE